MKHGSHARRLVVGAIVAWLTGASLVACADLVGVEEVTLKRNRDSSADATELIPEPPTDTGTRPIRPNVLQVALGARHSCARKVEGDVFCWGDNTQGQLAVETTYDFLSSPKVVEGVDDAIDIASGRNHTCVVRTNGKVACWGYNFDGQLGNGESTNRQTKPTDVVGLTNALAVTAGGNFSCAIRRDHTVACWGGNGSGQLGVGDDQTRTTPVAVKDLSDVVEIAAGLGHVCAVLGSGGVVCWGDGTNGQLGSNAMQGSSIPVAIEGVSDAVMVATTDRSSCVLTSSGTVSCWGANDLGQLCTGETNLVPNPVPSKLTTTSDVTRLQAGQDHVCATRGNGEIICWGGGARGQLGDGQARTAEGGAQPSVVTVSGIQNAIGIATGGEHSCAPTQGGAIVCWGGNDCGQLGNSEDPLHLPSPLELSPVTVIGFP